jgi:outer membrane protein, heavy metal efflux system
MTTHRRYGSSETPTAARRNRGLVVVVGLGLARSLAVAQPVASPLAEPRAPLAEADVIRMARSRSPGAAVANATDALADARTRTAAPLANPSVSWVRETIETGPVGSQDIVTVALPIDLARPLATRSLVAAQGAWMRAEASLSRTDAVLGAVGAYYDAVLAEARVEVLARAVANLEEAARVLARREAAGTASGYESTRLAIGRELARSQLEEARGAVTSAGARLAVMLGVRPETLQVPTSLTLLSAREEAGLARAGGVPPEAVRHARESQRRAGEARERAGWAWLPTLELGGGIKHVSDLGGGTGYVIGVSLGFPIFDRGQALRAEAQAQEALSAARSEALTRSLDAEVQIARATFRTARHELERFEAQTTEQVEALLTAAQSGYREGERSIVELLDAQRAQTDVAERRLRLLGTAKHAEARLRAAAGDLR